MSAVRRWCQPQEVHLIGWSSFFTIFITSTIVKLTKHRHYIMHGMELTMQVYMQAPSGYGFFDFYGFLLCPAVLKLITL